MIPKAKMSPHFPKFIAGLVVAFLLTQHSALGFQAAVNLRTAGNYAVLSKAGISTVPTSAVTGDMGVSPIDSTAITGFTLILDSSGQFSRSTQVTGKVYASDYANPTPANLTAAIGDMGTAYTDAAGRTLPDHTELGTGSIGGLTLAPGLYKWSTDVNIATDVIIAGGPTNVWIFQVAGNVTIASATYITLSGGANPNNIFWQVAGGVGVALGTTSQFQGNILAVAAITMQSGASITGRLLAQKAVTLQSNAITTPGPQPSGQFGPIFGPISRAANGAVNLVITNTIGVSLTLQSSTDLLNWTALTTVTPSVNPYAYTDTAATGGASRYYRAYNP